MLLTLPPAHSGQVIVVLGVAQTISWASSYYIPAVLAAPMAASFGLPAVWVFGAFSLALVVSAMVGPWAGARIDRDGGRGLLMVSNLVFATGLALLASAPTPAVLFAGWSIIGLGMGIGLYEAAFASLAAIYGKDTQGPITGITLIAGFASTLGWALIQLFLALPLNALLPKGTHRIDASKAVEAKGPPPPRHAAWLLAFVFAATWFSSTAMAAHLPGLLQAAGASTAVAIAAGALIGPAQEGARLLEFGLLRRFHPLISARLAALAHPVAAICLVVAGGPAAYAFALLHGAGNGMLTISKGTLPLALFGSQGYGALLGWLNAPARFLQAAAPMVFSAALAAWGLSAIWLTAGLGLLSAVALLILRRGYSP